MLERTGTIHLFRSTKKTVSASSATKGELNTSGAQTQPSPASASSEGTPATDGQDKHSPSEGTTSTLLVAPTGNFVSNHHPNLSGSPAPNLIASSCTTTPGATCQIFFTQGQTTKSLPAEATDAGGSAFWNWKLQDYGIGTGTWTIRAVVTLGTQTKSASDSQALVVAP